MARQDQDPYDTYNEDLWNEASNTLNRYADQEYGAGKHNINWDAAKNAYRQYATQGDGNAGDWVNWTYANRNSWLSPGGGTTATGKNPRFSGFDKSGKKAAGSSPKYAFYDVARNYDNQRSNLGTILSELQKKYPQWFSGWQMQSDDAIRYTGDQNALHKDWGGMYEFDVARGGDDAWQWIANKSYTRGNRGPGNVWSNDPKKPTGPGGKTSILCMPGYHQEGDKCVPDGPGGNTGGNGDQRSILCIPGYHQEGNRCVPDRPGGGNKPPVVNTPPNQYDDPNTKFLVDSINERLRNLKQPRDRSALEAYISELNQDPGFVEDFVNTLRGRMNELNSPVYSEGERDARRTQVMDPLKRSREALKRRYAEQLMAQGHAPTSGTITQTSMDLDREFMGQQAPLEAQLMLEERDETQRRKDSAVGLAGMALQALEGGRSNRLGNLGTVANLREGEFEQDQNRDREFLSTANLLPALDERRMLLALQAFGSTPGGNASAGLNNQLMQLLQLAQGSNQNAIQNALLQQQNRTAGTSAWLQALAQMLGLFGGGR